MASEPCTDTATNRNGQVDCLLNTAHTTTKRFEYLWRKRQVNNMNQTPSSAKQKRLRDHPIRTTAIAEGELKLLGAFHEDIARQSERMDDLAKQLITLELAIPGLYAVVLKLVSGEIQEQATSIALLISGTV